MLYLLKTLLKRISKTLPNRNRPKRKGVRRRYRFLQFENCNFGHSKVMKYLFNLFFQIKCLNFVFFHPLFFINQKIVQ